MKYDYLKKSCESAGHSIKRFISTPSDILSLFGIVIALVYGWLGWRTNVRMEDLSRKQIDIANEQNKTSINIAHFDSLLNQTGIILLKNSLLVELATKQIDSIVSVNRTLTSQAFLLNKQYDLNVSINKKNDASDNFKQIVDYSRLRQFCYDLYSTIDVGIVTYRLDTLQKTTPRYFGQRRYKIFYKLDDIYNYYSDLNNKLESFRASNQLFDNDSLFSKWNELNVNVSKKYWESLQNKNDAFVNNLNNKNKAVSEFDDYFDDDDFENECFKMQYTLELVFTYSTAMILKLQKQVGRNFKYASTLDWYVRDLDLSTTDLKNTMLKRVTTNASIFDTNKNPQLKYLFKEIRSSENFWSDTLVIYKELPPTSK